MALVSLTGAAPPAGRVPPPPSHHLANLMAGAAQAVVVTAVGAPFDYVKSLQQAEGLTAGEVVRRTLRERGPLGFYRGALAPLTSHMLKRPAQFPLAEHLRGALLRGDAGRTREGFAAANYAVGAVSGASGTLLGTPLQRLKVGTQTHRGARMTTSMYLRRVLQREGVAGLYRGFWPTLAKDTVFGASFLGHYFTLRAALAGRPLPGLGRDGNVFVAGAAAHCLTWLVFIPVDNVKTLAQRDGRGAASSVAPWRLALHQARTRGVATLWRGVVAACLRTVPVSGFGMLAYERVRRALGPCGKVAPPPPPR